MYKFDKRQNLFRVSYFAILFFLFLYLLVHIYLTIFTRYMADDYCTASTLNQEGFWGAQSYIRNSYSGRYSFFLLVLLIQSFGSKTVFVSSVVVMGLWFLNLTRISYVFLISVRNTKPVMGSLLLACGILWASYESIIDFPQIMYWQTGILTYTLFIVLVLVSANFVFYRAYNSTKIRFLELFMWGMFAFWIGGFSEVGNAVQIVLINSVLFFLYIAKRKMKKIVLKIVSSMSLGSVLSLIVLGIAPGNINRVGYGPPPPPIIDSIMSTFLDTIMFIPIWVANHTLVSGFVFFIGMIVSFDSSEFYKESYSDILKKFMVIVGVTLVIVGAALSPSYLVRGFPPPERSLIIPIFFVVLFITSLGWLSVIIVTKIFSEKIVLCFRWVVLVLLVVGLVQGVIPSVRAGFNLIKPLKTYATLWDSRESEWLLASQNGQRVVVGSDFSKNEELRPLRTKLWITGDLESFPDYWINMCAAQYYGLDELYVK